MAKRESYSDPRSTQLFVEEIHWKKLNHLFYDENGVKIYSIPTIHIDQSIGCILKCKGLTFAYSGGAAPNKWYLEHAKGADLAIHETMLPPDMWLDKYSMSPQAAVMSGTQGHTTPAAFGKVMSIVHPRLAVASHFQNDFDTATLIESEIRSQYDGPLNLGLDFMAWNITKENITTRMAVANPESFPPPAQVPAKPPVNNGGNYQWDPFRFTGLEKETSAVTNNVVEKFNSKHGTDIEPILSNIPFKKTK